MNTDRLKAVAVKQVNRHREKNVAASVGVMVALITAVLRRFEVELSPEEAGAVVAFVSWLAAHFTPKPKWDGVERRE